MDPLLRKRLYVLFLAITVGMMVARIANVELLYEPSLYKAYPARKWPSEKPDTWPTFSSNDRARWATVKSVVEEGTFVIGKRTYDEAGKYKDEGILFTDGFKSVDVVLHPDRNEFFATKPPLLTVAVAGEYWLLHKFMHWNISEHRWEVVVSVLLVFNVLPLAIGLWLLSRLIEEYGTTDWGRLFVFAMACFGTFLTTFSITLNNHIPATCAVTFSVYALLRGKGTISTIFAGLCAGIAMCMDLPAAALAGSAGLIVLVYRGWLNALLFTIAFAIPIAIQTYINYREMGTLLPIYAQFGGPWYEYPGSHWAKRLQNPPPAGIDFIQEPKHIYAFHLLFGHHGLFSLTPIWLISIIGFCLNVREGASRLLHRLSVLILLVVVGFYIYKTNNYGGWTCGPRWLFWLNPLLILAAIPAADKLGQWKASRFIAYLFLAVSIFSITYPSANPWRHPWILQWCEYMDWIHY